MLRSAIFDRRTRIGLPAPRSHKATGYDASAKATRTASTYCFSDRCSWTGQTVFGCDKSSTDCAAESVSATFAFRHLWLHSIDLRNRVIPKVRREGVKNCHPQAARRATVGWSENSRLFYGRASKSLLRCCSTRVRRPSGAMISTAFPH